MRSGGGNPKGAEFERYCCKRLSLWLTHGRRDDCLWRSAMSGGRATFQFKRGILNWAQAGDVTAISAEAIALCETFLFECKHYADLNFPGLLINGTGLLAGFWQTTKNAAARLGKTPALIARQNRYPTVILTPIGNSIFDAPLATLHGFGVEMHLFELATEVVRRRIKRPNIYAREAAE